MEELERRRMIRSRIRRAQSALDRAATLLEARSHVETIENALIEAVSEAEEAEKLLQPLWRNR
jgi:hypothetical protein